MNSRTLNHGDLVDIKQATERGLLQIPEVLLARRMDDAEGLVDALTAIADAFVIVISLTQCCFVDDDDPEDEGTIVPVEQVANFEGITRNGGRADG